MGPEKILNIMCGFMKSKVLLVSQKIGIFDAISDDGSCHDMIANDLKTDANMTKYLLNSLYKLGFLERKGDMYYNSSISREFLMSKSENYIGDLLIFQDNEWDEWSKLYELVKSGKTSFHSDEMSGDELSTYMKAMDEIGRYTSHAIKTSLDLKGHNKIIDLGCGSGIFSIALKEKYPNNEMYMVDFEKVIEICKNNIINRFGTLDGFSFFEGNYMDLNFEKKFDCVFISHNIHQYDEANIKYILSKAKKILIKNGILVLHDYFIGEKTEFPDLFTFNMSLQKDKAHCLTFEEIKTILIEVGFSNIKFVDMGHGIPSSMIICNL
jgi:ribosomal protein L11 methyltransferase (prmA)